MQDYDRRDKTAHDKESARLRALAKELEAIEHRLREIQDELPFSGPSLSLVPREFRSLYDSRGAAKDLETASVKINRTVSQLQGGARIIETYEK